MTHRTRGAGKAAIRFAALRDKPSVKNRLRLPTSCGTLDSELPGVGMQETEGDTRYHLPRGMAKITPEREQHGDILVERDEDGNVRHIQKHLSTVLNELDRRGTLTPQHVHDGQTYEIWQTIFRAKLGYRNNPIYQADLAGMRRMVSADDLQVDDFGRLIHKLGGERCQMIEAAIYEHVTPRTLHFIDGNSARFRMAFDRLSEVMELLREDWRKRQEEKAE